MVDSELEVVGCSRIGGEEHGAMSQQTWVLVLAAPALTGCVTLASHAGLGISPHTPFAPGAAPMRQRLEESQLIAQVSEDAPLWGGLCLPLQSSMWSKWEAFLLFDAVTLQFWACHVVPNPQLHVVLWLHAGT